MTQLAVQAAKTQAFRTADGAFMYNLAANMAQMSLDQAHWHNHMSYLQGSKEAVEARPPNQVTEPPPKPHRPSPGPGHSRTKRTPGTPDLYREGHSKPFSGNLTRFPGTCIRMPPVC